MYGLRRYECDSFAVPFGYPRLLTTPARTGLGAVTTLPITPDPFSSGLQGFGIGVLQSPWFYLGLGLLGFSLYLGPLGRAKQRRRRKNLIPPLTAGIYAAGAGAGGYLLGKYSGL